MGSRDMEISPSVTEEVLRESRDLIISRWLREWQARPERPFMSELLASDDWFDRLLDSLSYSLDGLSADPNSMFCITVGTFGEECFRRKIWLSEFVRALGLLRLVVLEELVEADDAMASPSALVRLSSTFDDAVSTGVVMYNGFQEQSLREESRRKNEFLALLGHELRNPLGAANSAVQILINPANAPPVKRQALDVIQRQLGHIICLVDDLQDMARIGRNLIDLQSRPIEMRGAIERAILAVSEDATTRGQRIRKRLPRGPVWVNADPHRLNQILVNVLSNAVRYTPSEGRIHVHCRVTSGDVIISVKDNGIGIAPERLDTIFEPFTQVDDALQHSREGLGLGLSLVRDLVRLHGGSVVAQSEGIGHGTSMTMRFPCVAPPRTGNVSPELVTTTSAAADDDLRPEGLHVLLIDDNEEALQMLGILLGLNGCHVTSAINGRAALRAVEDFVPDVVLSDISLPDMSGHEIARTLRADERFAKTTLIAITGYAHDASRSESEAAGFDHHLTKPLDIKRLNVLLAAAPKAET